MRSIVKYGPWIRQNFCTDCKTMLSDDEIYSDSHTCPYCGKVGKYICKTYKRYIRKVYTYIPGLIEKITKGKKEEWYWEIKQD